MERGEWEDDAEYPAAPLPAHERVWRHPSEQGATQWVQSEPPLVVGRGLSVATGTVGVVLAVGLLWLMVPHDNPSGGVAAQSSTSLRTTSGDTFVSRQSSTLAATAPAEITNTPLTAIATITSQRAEVTTTMPTSSPPSSSGANSPTTALTTPTATATTATTELGPLVTSEPPPPVESVQPLNPTAVALVQGHFVVATAAAVGDQESMTVQLPTGPAVATVVSVDTASGIAVLSVPGGTDTGPIAPSEQSLPTDAAVVMTPGPTPASVWTDDSGVMLTSDPAMPVAEGSLVLDSDDHLIGMCTRTATGIHVLGAGSLLAAINGAIEQESRPWAGIHIQVTDAGDLSVVEISAGGPADLAGIPLGSVVTALDGVAVHGTDGLAAFRAAIRAHVPGDVVTLSIVASDASAPTDIAVTLVPNPGSF